MTIRQLIVFLLIGAFALRSSHGKPVEDQPHGLLQNVFSTIGKMLGLEPEVAMSASEMIKYYGYPVETHEIVTEDGYILTNYRIPHGRNSRPADSRKLPVLLVHGLYGSSDMWIANLPDKSLAFQLADAGFDVWMLNCKGNIHSRKHVTLKTSEAAFWDFSIDELVYDLAALIDNVINITGKRQIYLVAHSLGGTVAIQLLASRSDYNAKVKKMYSIAPGGILFATRGIVRILLKNTKLFVKMLNMLKSIGIHELFSTISIPKVLLGAFAKYFQPPVKSIILLGVGPSPDSWNATRTPINVARGQGSFPVNLILHLYQFHSSKRIEHFDWGQKKNIEKYSQPTPPCYDLSKVVVPSQFFCTANDYIVSKGDVEYYKNGISGSANVSIAGPDWNHISYFWATDAGDFFNGLIHDMIQV